MAPTKRASKASNTKAKAITKTQPKSKTASKPTAKSTTKGKGKQTKITSTLPKKRAVSNDKKADKNGTSSSASTQSTQSEFEFKDSQEEVSHDSAVVDDVGVSKQSKAKGKASAKSKKASSFKNITGSMSKDELLKRLKALLAELQGHQQHENVSEEIARNAEMLVDTSLLRHKDKVVKIYVACCLAEVLRLYAPETPYNDEVLATIFRFFITQLRGLANHQSPSFTLVFSLLEILAFVHSFVLCIELPESTELFCSLVATLKETVSVNHSNKLVSYMADLVAGSLKEMDSIETELLISILEPLLLDNKEANPTQYSLSRLILQKAETAMQGDLTRFFREILTGDNKSRADSVHGGNVYELLGEISSIAPNALLYIYPLLKQMLEINYDPQIKDEKQQKRYQATHLLCRMFSGDPTMLDTHRGLWDQLMQRLNDIEPLIRAEVATHCNQFVSQHPRHAADIIHRIGMRVLDPHESVRMATVQAVCATAMSHPTAVPKDVFEKICGRSKDKKPEVRDLTVKQIGEVYKTLLLGHAGTALLSTSGRGTHDRELLEVYGTIPEYVFSAYTTGSASGIQSTQRIAETAIQNCLIDNKATAEERALQVLNMYMSLAETGKKAYAQFIRHKISLSGTVKKYCDLRIGLKQAEDRDETDIKAKQLLNTIAGQVGGNVSGNFEKLLKIHKSKDLALFKLILKAQQVNISPAKRREIMADVLTKVKEKDVVKTIFSRTSMVNFSQDLISHQLKQLRTLANEDTEFENIEFLKVCSYLKMLAQLSPAHFDSPSLLEGLIELLKADTSETVDAGLQLLALMGDSLRHGNAKSLLESTHPLMHDMILTGTPRQSKLAVKVWAAATVNPDAAFDDLLAELTSEDRLKFDHEFICTTLSALSTIAIVAPLAFGAKSGPAVLFVVKDLLQNNRTFETGDIDHREINAKVLGVKLLVKRLLGMDARASIATEAEENKAVDAFKITNKLLRALIANKRFCPDPMSEEDDAKLRLVGASGYLKVATCKSFKPLLPASQLDLLALIAEDPEESVRKGFSKKLMTGLSNMKLDISFLALVTLAALDPSEELRKSAKASYIKLVDKYKQISTQLKASGTNEQVLHKFRPELSLPTLLSIIAHRDEDNSEEVRMRDAETILTFCLDVLTQHEKGSQGESYDYLHTIVARVKNCTDALRNESEDLYVVCDLATLMITNYAHRNIKNWIIQPFPSKIKLHAGFFSMDRKAPANNQSYLPSGFELGGIKAKAAIKSTKVKPKAIAPHTSPAKKGTKRAATSSETRKTQTTSAKVSAKSRPPKKHKAPVEASRRQASRGAKAAIGTMKVHSDSESDGEGEMEVTHTAKKPHRSGDAMDELKKESQATPNSSDRDSDSDSDAMVKKQPAKKRPKKAANEKAAGASWQPTLTTSTTSQSESVQDNKDAPRNSPAKPKRAPASKAKADSKAKTSAKAKADPKAKASAKAKKSPALQPRKRKNQVEAAEDGDSTSASGAESSALQSPVKASKFAKITKAKSKQIGGEIDADEAVMEGKRGKALFDTDTEEQEIDIDAPRRTRSRPTPTSSTRDSSDKASPKKAPAKKQAQTSVATTATTSKKATAKQQAQTSVATSAKTKKATVAKKRKASPEPANEEDVPEPRARRARK